MLTKNDIKALEEKYGFSPLKKLGQNFLIDDNIRRKLLEYSGIETDDIVLEIGPGLGQLTFDLSKAAKKIIAVEFDKKLFSILSGLAKGAANIILVHGDFLKLDLEKILPKYKKIKIVSNLPYYISSPVILKLFTHSDHIHSAVLTLQKEVADRLTAKPGTKEYSSLTLFAEFHASIKRLFNISKNSFYPSPNVRSTVLYLAMRENPPVKVDDKNELFELIRAGFSKRRKMLVNSLYSQSYKGFSKDELAKILNKSGIPCGVRAEELALSDFANILNSVKRHA